MIGSLCFLNVVFVFFVVVIGSLCFFLVFLFVVMIGRLCVCVCVFF